VRPPGEPALRWHDGAIDPLALAGLPGRRLAAVLTVRGWTVVVGEPVGLVREPAELDSLGTRCGWRCEPWVDGPPFLGGAVGYLTDDVAGDWLSLGPDRRPERTGIPSTWFALHDRAVCIPPEGRGAWLVAADLPDHSRTRREDRLDLLAAQIGQAAVRPGSARPAPSAPPTLSLDRATHRAAVERVAEWIAAGDLYQLNLTLQVGVPWREPGTALARRLWDASPLASHAAWLDVGAADLVSVSPETFLATDGDAVRVRPIKGTRPRGDDPVEDAARARCLADSAKDRAEHVMIVDLERNDLGRVCAVGSVGVPELLALERHPTVWHLTSTVTGRLLPSVGLGDLLKATFPCGSVTGAPKRMAVARTRMVEPVRRGVYCGAIGVVSRGLLDLSVAIRTAVLRDGVARYGTGGGIVADSNPTDEFEEAMDKAAAFLRAVDAPRPR
jgi:para-aminobenzoate synthetase component I